MKFILTLLCVAAAAAFTAGELKPAADAREYFATNFYRVLVYHQNVREQSFVISPAVIQKLLTVVYNGADDALANEIVWDLQLKHIDVKRLFEDARKEGITDIGFSPHLREKQLEELKEPLSRKQVLDFFKNDFREVEGTIVYENYLVAPKTLKFSTEFKKFANEYFATTLLNENPGEIAEVERSFGVKFSDANKDNLQILSVLKLQANWKHGFNELDGQLTTKGNFKVGNLTTNSQANFVAQVVELPLEANAPLSMLIIIPDGELNMFLFLSQLMGRSVEDFNAVSNSLKEQIVTLKLPRFKIEKSTNLADFLSENTYQGVHELFTKNVSLSRMFENTAATGIKAANFWQKSVVEVNVNGIGAVKERKVVETKSVEPELKVDATKNPFFFVIKSAKTLYFMGHYIQ